MCIGSNWVNEAQDLIYVTKFCDLPNKQNPNQDQGIRNKWETKKFRCP